MSERDEDIKATAEDLISDAERLKRIEQAKMDLHPDDPRVAKLADEANRIIARMAPKGAAQRQLVTDAKNA